MYLQSAAHAFAFDSVFQFVRGILGVFHTIKVIDLVATNPFTHLAGMERRRIDSGCVLGSVARYGEYLRTVTLYHAYWQSPLDAECTAL